MGSQLPCVFASTDYVLCGVLPIFLSPAVPCPALAAPTNGAMIGSDFFFNKSVSFTCQPGYALVGVSPLVCLRAGHWNAPAPRCENTCPTLQPLLHGTVVGGQTQAQRLLGASASFSCHQGYQLSKASTATCLSTAQWSVVNQSCDPVMCPSLSTPVNGQIMPVNPVFAFPNTARLTCNTGYSDKGISDVTLLCQANSTWSRAVLTCSGM